MAYGGPSNYKDNFGRYQQYATINITKAMAKYAEECNVDIAKAVAEQLEKVHKANVEASYYPRARSEQAKMEYNKSQKQLESEYNEDKAKKDKKRFRRKTLSYKHTGTLLTAIHADVEKKSRYELRAVIKIRPEPYPDNHYRKDEKDVTAIDVYQWLREGTEDSGKTYWFTNQQGERPVAYNYSTPAHLFEMHTQIQMQAYMRTLTPQAIKQLAKNRRFRLK